MSQHVDDFVSIIIDVPNEYWREEHFLMDLEGKWQYSAGIESSGILVAFLIASLKKNSIHIHKFMVRKDYRSKGIGKLLLDQFLTNLPRNLNSVSLKVYKENKRAIEFYLSNDFRICSEDEELIEMMRIIT